MIDDQRPNDTGPDFTLTTKQVAERFGLSQEAIRKIKSQNQDRLIEGTHWVNFEGRTCWDESAIAVIEAIRNGTVTENATVTDEGGTLTTQALQSSDSTDALTLDTLAADFDNALRPHAQRVARERVARRWERLVAEAEQQEMARLIDAANRGDVDLYGFTDPLFIVGAIPASRNGHKQLTGVSDA